ncbi:Protein BIG GRAIN 1-like A [Quillaja saponaria]|uniref:Protein BIG GRAIN 1-like A n=1 Tax=Quillaja saponaria TaxID=32244 RepID=A0AAD7LHY9_QUISA|nr:Protein BIG GRAIN 1-like A [Quillaja saponaria]
MYRRERIPREERFQNDPKNPSFSSSLLDKIYHSIDEGDKRSGEVKFVRETMGKKQSSNGGKYNRAVGEEVIAKENLRRSCLLEKWMDKKVSTQRRECRKELDRRSQHNNDHDQDVLFFSSTSSSSDSSSGGFSSSDTESVFGVRSGTSRFEPPRPKPIRTTVSACSVRSEKTERKHSTLFYEQREMQHFTEYNHNLKAGYIGKQEEGLMKSKPKALKIYNNLKKVKQPISPGGRLTNFINSLFTAGNTKKTKSSCSVGGYEDTNKERKLKSEQISTCSSASSFSRSCLSKNSPSTREKLRNGVKRNVHFYPVSVIVDEDCRPCGQKSLYEEEDRSLVSVSVPTAWKIGPSPARKNAGELKYQVMEKSRRVEEAAREFLKDYHQNQKKNDLIMRDLRLNVNQNEDNEDDDDAASYSSSDLFELDHLTVMGNGRYCQELPVYETTHVSTNRAIANGLIM